jgi:putative transposase
MTHIRIPLQHNRYYHIYNRGINSCPIFKETTNYEHFLSLYDKYISPIAQTYAWVLMGNHFHLLVRIKRHDEIIKNPQGFKNLEGLNVGLDMNLEKRINQQFSNLFNAYTKAFNKRYFRTGSLFEHTFHRKLIDTDEYLRQVILYIHNNPIHHGFCKHPIEYPWSSYLTCTSDKATKLKRDEVIAWFGGIANYEEEHRKILDPTEMDIWLGV